MEATIDQSEPKFSLNINQYQKNKEIKRRIKGKDKNLAETKSSSLAVETKDDRRVSGNRCAERKI